MGQLFTAVPAHTGNRYINLLLSVGSGAYCAAELFSSAGFVGNLPVGQSFLAIGDDQVFLCEAHRFSFPLKFDILGTPNPGHMVARS